MMNDVSNFADTDFRSYDLINSFSMAKIAIQWQKLQFNGETDSNQSILTNCVRVFEKLWMC